MEFENVLNQSQRGNRSVQDIVATGSHIKKTIKGGQQLSMKRVDPAKNMSVQVEQALLLE